MYGINQYMIFTFSVFFDSAFSQKSDTLDINVPFSLSSTLRNTEGPSAARLYSPPASHFAKHATKLCSRTLSHQMMFCLCLRYLTEQEDTLANLLCSPKVKRYWFSRVPVRRMFSCTWRSNMSVTTFILAATQDQWYLIFIRYSPTGLASPP